MSFDANILPDNLEELKQLVLTGRVDLEASREDLAAAKAGLMLKTLKVEKLKVHIARLQRMKFGPSSERVKREIEQLELRLEELETAEAESEAASEAAQQSEGETPGKSGDRKSGRKPKEPRRNFPAHLPQTTQVHEPDGTCPTCGGSNLRKVGEDSTKVLEYIPGRFAVVCHVRPVCSCRTCETMVQAPMPPLPIPRGMAGPGLLAHIAVSKFCDHLPLYRQAAIYQREGVELDRSMMANWLGHCAWLVRPFNEAIGNYVKAAPVIHADDTPVKMLAPGAGKTKTARFWVYLFDGRPHASNAPPAVLYRYTPDRKGDHPQKELADFKGFLHADGYPGFDELYAAKGVAPPDVFEISCWSHARRKFFDVHKTTKSSIAWQAIEHIGELFDIERTINGKPPGERLAVRQAEALPLLERFGPWLDERLTRISGKSELAKAIRYVRTRWQTFIRYTGDGRLEISNNAAERQIRPAAVGRKNWLFVGSEAGGDTAACFYTLIGSAKLNGLDPELYLRYLFEHAGEHPINRIDELLPWNIGARLPQIAAAA